MESNPVVSVLAEIAETVSESVELQEVFNRVAAAVRRLIPFENMGVVRIIDGRFAVLHATTAQCTVDDRVCSDPEPLTSWSPRVRPRPAPIPRVDDAEAEMDASFKMDASVLGSGVKSALWAPFRPAEAFRGGVFLSASRTHAFTDEHQAILDPIAALLGSGVEHWRIWDAERARRERLDQLETILGPLSRSLDVREVFDHISAAVRPILPHDLLVLTDIDVTSRIFRVVAVSGEADISAPVDPIRLSELETDRRSLEFEIYRDMPEEIQPSTERNQILLATGMRSWMKVPVWRDGVVRGAVGFMHREPSRFGPEDSEIARRIADRIALAVSHHELAEKARLAAEAGERAAKAEAAVEVLTRELAAQGRGRVVGVSRSWKDVLRQIGRVASSDTTVLVTGESGTGKEVVARMLHQGSPRSGGPFVAINCAALPEQLLESELFGHEKGAFTGAVAAKAGRLEQAAGGTLFLDEIAEMSPVVQAKFLRLLQEREFRRVGGTRDLKADVRVIAATNRDLTTAMARGQFREDLFYRLNVFEIHVEPLRSRPEDILPLAEAFVEDLGRTMGRPAAGISRDARGWLLRYSWPGNVRELRNAVERAILLCDGGLISHEHLPSAMIRAAGPEPPPPGAARQPGPAQASGNLRIDSAERILVEKALREAGGNKSQAARLLGLTRAQLYSRIQKYGVN